MKTILFWILVSPNLALASGGSMLSSGGAGSGNLSGSWSSVGNLVSTNGVGGAQDSSVPAPVVSTRSTTDGTTQTIYSVTIPTNSVVFIKTTVLARQTGGTAGNVGDSGVFVRSVRCKNVSGSITAVGLFSDFTSKETGSPWDSSTSAGTTTCDITVTGGANNNISWKSFTEVRVN